MTPGSRLVLTITVGLAAGGCLASPHPGSPGDFPSLRIPTPRPPHVREASAEPWPDPDGVDRDPFLTKAEETPEELPPAPPPPPPPPPPRPTRQEVRCPSSCEVTAIIEGRASQFVCGKGIYGVGDTLDGHWRVGDIRVDGVLVREVDGPRSCHLPFARAAAAPIQGG